MIIELRHELVFSFELQNAKPLVKEHTDCVTSNYSVFFMYIYVTFSIPRLFLLQFMLASSN